MNKIELSLKLLTSTDVYKVGHKTLYPKKTEIVFSNFTPRSENWATNKLGFVVADGMRYVVNKLKKEFEVFFNLSLQELDIVKNKYKELVEKTISVNDFNVDHLTKLHALGYLPLEFRAVEEGTKVPFKTPVLTIHNTNKEFAWLVNYYETKISSELWPIITASTIAYGIKQQLLGFAEKTGTSKDFVPYQAHDFSYRGMMGSDAAILTGMGHLRHFEGSDVLPAILETGKGASVIATEHSIMSAGTKEGELETYRRLIKDNPNGILSIVSDTWNIYNVVDVILPTLKEDILARKGKLVIRPDSGEPIGQLLGEETIALYENTYIEHQMQQGLFKLIEKHFGYKVNEKGYKVLPIGFLWGDGMTPDKINEIFSKMEEKGYASENLIVGVGSFTYQMNTRDTYGFAMKATYVEVDGKGVNITKDPITDSGVKKSAKGLLAIIDGELVQETNWETVGSKENELKEIITIIK